MIACAPFFIDTRGSGMGIVFVTGVRSDFGLYKGK